MSESNDQPKLSWTQLSKWCDHIRDDPFMQTMQRRREDLGSKSPMGWLDAAMLYALTRMRKPRVIVETGGFLGMSSAFMLKALADENALEGAKVYSVEFLEDIEHGALIPDVLKAGGTFVPMQGRVEDFMKRGEFPDQVDFFLHDSSHRYKHMRMEYRYFWDRLGDGDVLVSHDVNLSAAFPEFVAKTYKHDKIGQTDFARTSHYDWGRWGNLAFMIKKGPPRA